MLRRYDGVSMRIAILGSGSVGGYFGGRMAAAGCDVTFIARGPHLAAIRERGLRVQSPVLGDALVHPAKATDDPAQVGIVDCVVIAVKLWDTVAAAKAALPMLGPESMVVSLQNGVESDAIKDIVGARRLVGGVAFIASTVDRPGVICHLGTMQRVVIGELGGGSSRRVERLHEALESGGIAAEISDDIQRTIWEKFVFLVGLSAATTLVRAPLGPIREDAEGRELLFSAMRETVAVARARGIALDKDFAESRLEFVEGLPADMTSSMHQDLQQGNPLEVAWLSGAVVRFGREAGIPTPVNQTVYAALKPIAAGRR